MWLCTKIGFFSIVKKGTPETWQVRARVSKDLEALIAAAEIKTNILATPQGDYGWRIVVDGNQLGRIFQTLAASVDYSNFKSCIAQVPGQREKLDAYHDFWGAMNELQTRQK
jgi:hypothetical protein